MAITAAFEGSETVSTGEHSLVTDTPGYDTETSDGVFQCFLDLTALVTGDEFQFRIYEKVLAGGLEKEVYEVRFVGPQFPRVWPSPCLILMHGWDMTLKKVAGGDRNIDWSVRKVA